MPASVWVVKSVRPSTGHLRMRERFRNGENLAGRNATPAEPFDPVGGISGGKGLFDLGAQGMAIGLARLAGRVVGMGEKIRPVQFLAQQPPLFVLVGGDVEGGVPGPEGSGGGGGRVLVAVGGGALAGDHPVGNDPSHRGEGCFQHRYVAKAAVMPPIVSDTG